MSLQHAWEREYQSPQFITKDTAPLRSVQTFFRFLKKQGVEMASAHILDLGCGIGRNTIYAMERGAAHAIGYDISPTAIRTATNLAREAAVQATFAVHNIAHPFPIADHTIDVAIDSTASQSLTSAERTAYLEELHRVLRPNGWLFVRTLAKDGDANAKWLLKQYPTKHPDMYRMPDTGIEERVFSEKDIRHAYANFRIAQFKKTTGYVRMNGKSYKRNYFLCYAQPI